MGRRPTVPTVKSATAVGDYRQSGFWQPTGSLLTRMLADGRNDKGVQGDMGRVPIASVMCVPILLTCFTFTAIVTHH